MDANKAMEFGFADDVLKRDTDNVEDNVEDSIPSVSSILFSQKAVSNSLVNKLTAKYGEKEKPTVVQETEIPAPEETGRPVNEIMERLNLIKHHI